MAEDQLTSQSAAFGQALTDMPIRGMLQTMAESIVDAQRVLDESSFALCRKLASSKVELLDSTGSPVKRSLLDLGLLPSFYHFSEANLELSVALSMRAEDASSLKVGFDVGASFGQKTTESTSTGEEEDLGTTIRSNTAETDTGSSSTTTIAPTAAPPEKSRTVGVSFGMSLDYETSRKYAFDASGAAKIKAKLVSVPAPGLFLDAVVTNARGRRAAG